MHLKLTEEQRLLEASALDVLAAEYGIANRQASLAHPDGCRPVTWELFAELGWLALPIAESTGGLAGSELELGLLMQAMGRHLVVEPYLACIVLAARLASALEGPTLAAVLGGRERMVLAHGELAVDDPYAAPRCRAERTSSGWWLSGFKPLVAGAPGAHVLLVSAVDEAGRTGVYQVSAHAAGLAQRTCGLADGGKAADLRLSDVPAQRLDLDDVDVLPLLKDVLARAVVASCWEAHGAMRAAFERTVEYTRQRVQFGQPLARFQVVQHRLAEMFVCCEEARAACLLASLRLDLGPRDLETTLGLAAMAKSKVGRAARFVAQEAVQLHGAMGVCEELPVAAAFRKLTAFGQQLGATTWHTARLGALQLERGEFRQSQTLVEPASMST